ncbi:hypothetical protein K501DRAFT_272575 [Backusella circina FSU 941]|nr:hypothetical protein K501DRAFT_272575 [Backusella circina FSU 941]
MILYLRSIIPRHDGRHCNRSDSIIACNSEPGFEAEIFLLKTSNGYGVANPTKKCFDHHKSVFDLLLILKNVADECSYIVRLKAFQSWSIISWMHARTRCICGLFPPHLRILKQYRYKEYPVIAKVTENENFKGMGK